MTTSECNGSVQKAVRDMKDQIRVMRCALERHVGPAHLHGAWFEWLIVWAAELLTDARVGQDGMTAFRRLRGKQREPRLAGFAEQDLARRPEALLQVDAEPRWDHVTYLGSCWGPRNTGWRTTAW